MGFIKKILLFILMIVGAGAGIIIATHYLPTEEWNGKAFVPSQLTSLVTDGTSRIRQSNIGASVQQLSQQISGKVLGVYDAATASSATQSSQATDSAKVSSSSASLPQKTFEFARYTYCKDVVAAYEATKK